MALTAKVAPAQTPEPAHAGAKGKTKAKQRYLKRKKERRKGRKAAAPHKSEKVPNPSHPVSSDEDEDSESVDDHEEVVVEAPVPEREAPSSSFPASRKDESRPRKRRKTVDDDEDEDKDNAEDEDDEDEDKDEDEDVEESPSLPPRRSPTPVASLRSFPLPTRPDAPSKSQLALQGLDQVLSEAEIVDAATLMAIPDGKDEKVDSCAGLSVKMRKRLRDLGITELFAVQTALLPFLLPSDPRKRALYLPYDPPRDVCVSAPTGSGKTLAYVVPIVEILSARIVTRLRALVVLPTRDLVTQVQETFEAIAKGRGLKIGTATGQHSFAHEQTQIVADRSSKLLGGSSKVDILICTPGRLIDHLNATPNFSLQHLRFLVIDEADRLLAQSFQDWLSQVLAAVRPPSRSEDSSIIPPHSTPPLQPFVEHHDALSPTWQHLFHGDAPLRTDFDEKKEPSCQKLLFSATLTQDPGKLASLSLRDPKYYMVRDSKSSEGGVLDVMMDRFTMPATLTEHMIVCDSLKKPLMLFYLVHAHNVTNALVFTKSAESTTRLVQLFRFFEEAQIAQRGGSTPISVHAYSSDLSPGERKSILDKFKAQEIKILVCSDLISRGIDISHVSHVVSYDVPVDMRKYVHRVGRTARAGRAGDAWTLVEEQEARYFKDMMKSAERLEKIKRMRVSEKEITGFTASYEAALDKLKEAFGR